MRIEDDLVDQNASLANMFMTRISSSNETSRQRVRAAFLRTLANGRDSTFSQIQRIRRLIRFSSQIGTALDSDNSIDFFEDSDESSSDDV